MSSIPHVPTFMPRSVWVVLTTLLLTVTHVAAQSYTYKTIDIPIPNHGVKVTGLTDKGIMVGTYWADSDGQERSWLYNPTTKKYTTVNGPGGVPVWVMDVTPNLRVTGIYFNPQWKQIGFTKLGSTFTPIGDPTSTIVDRCSIAPTAGIIACVYRGPTPTGSSPWGATFL